MCTEVNTEYFGTIHHEMGHIEYFMAYENQTEIFKNGANCAFHEAIGDTITLSVLSRTHLERLKLIEPSKNDNKVDVQSKQSIFNTTSSYKHI